MVEERLVLRHPRGTSTILVGAGILDRSMSEIAAWCGGRKTFLVSSRPVLDLFGERITAALVETTDLVLLEVPDGEAAKTPEVAARAWGTMLAAGGKRDSRVITLGGGSLGDLGGFLAGTFLRGIEFCQIPTTLLAQVDASVGGKTGVDLPEGKNTVGVFHHPTFVVADTDLLASLPLPERRSGLVEVIKMAALLDEDLFDLVESDLQRLIRGNAESLAPVVAAAIAAKIRVVEEDPEEGGVRRLLNFGHTLGHAIETELGYEGIRHGEAVAWGILFALHLAACRGMPPSDKGRIEGLIRRLELPPLPALGVDALLSGIARDKKAVEGGVTWVFAASLGEGIQVPGIQIEELRGPLQAFLARES